MTRNYKIATLIVFTVIIVPSILMGSCAVQIARYRNEFPKVKTESSKETIIELMGKPSKARSCDFSIYNGNKQHIGDCVEIFTYSGIYEQWEIAFDVNGNVIEKYYWFLGEYGKRPPDTN